MQEMTHNHTIELDRFYHSHHKECTNCNHVFTEGETSHLGYLKDRSPAVLCDRCSILLDETVIRYYWMNKPFDEPNPDDKLWRYMDIAKFVSMLISKSLYFTPATAFSDIFEGAKGVIENKEKWDNYYLEFFRHAIKTAPGISPEETVDPQLTETAQKLLSEMHQHGALNRSSTCISCWHCNESESEAMWQLYSKNVTNAIAIQTTARKLYEALGENPYIDIGKVNYIDYRTRFSNIGGGAFWFKRKSFEHEHEVRALVRNPALDGKGCSLPIDLNILIEGIYISPYASRWFEVVVRDIVSRYGLDKPIINSSMADTPFY